MPDVKAGVNEDIKKKDKVGCHEGIKERDYNLSIIYQNLYD